MDGIKRNLLFWGYTIGQMILMILVMAFGVSIVTELGERENIFRAFCGTMAQYGSAYMVFVMGILGMTVINNHMPFTLSMGSTRKDSFVGMEVMLHLESLLLSAIIFAADVFAGKTADSAMVLNGVILWVCSIVLCNIVGWSYLQFGKTFGLIMYFVLTLGGVVGISLLTAMNAAGVPEKWGLQSNGLSVLVAAAAIVADCVMIWLYAGKIKRLEVRV